MAAVVVVLAALQVAWVLGEVRTLIMIVGNGSLPTWAMVLLWLGTALLCTGAIRFALNVYNGNRFLLAALLALVVATAPLDPIYQFILPYMSGVGVTFITLIACFVVRRTLPPR